MTVAVDDAAARAHAEIARLEAERAAQEKIREQVTAKIAELGGKVRAAEDVDAVIDAEGALAAAQRYGMRVDAELMGLDEEIAEQQRIIADAEAVAAYEQRRREVAELDDRAADTLAAAQEAILKAVGAVAEMERATRAAHDVDAAVRADGEQLAARGLPVDTAPLFSDARVFNVKQTDVFWRDALSVLADLARRHPDQVQNH